VIRKDLLVIRKDRELVARLTTISQNLETINQHVSELLRCTGEHHSAGGVSARDLRSVGYRLVSLAGDLTTLGVDVAHWADELDEAIGTARP
jgi:hypothetical protein